MDSKYHFLGNRLTILPPELGNLDMTSNKAAFRFEGNEWVQPIADQLQLGINHLQDYLKSETYRMYVLFLLQFYLWRM